MRKPLRCLAGAVLANALIFTAVAAPAVAQESETPAETSVTTTTLPPTTSSTTTSAPTSSSSESSESTTTPPTSTSDSETSAPGSTIPTTDTTTTQPSESSSTTQPTSTPPEGELPPYVDDAAWGVDIDPENGIAMLLIACAAGEPRNTHSADFEILEGPHQDEVDGRYWYYFVQLNPGLSFAENDIEGYWECGGEQTGGGGAPIAPVPGSGDAGDWQDNNDGEAQVKFAPKGGVETGFGGLARS